MSYSRFRVLRFKCLWDINMKTNFVENDSVFLNLNKILRSKLSTAKRTRNSFQKLSYFFTFKPYSTYDRDVVKEFNFIAREIGQLKAVTNDELSRILKSVQMVGRNITEKNFYAIFLDICRTENFFSIGKDFFYLLYSENKCNVATIGKFFRLCYDYSFECSIDDKRFLITLFDELLRKHPILDARSCENVALGISITEEWKRGLQLLKMTNFSSTAPPIKMYSALIEAAFLNRDFYVADELLHEMALENRDIPCEVYKSWLESSESPLTTFYEILKFIEKYNIRIKEEVSNLFLDFFKKHNAALKYSSVTHIHHNGFCQNCKRPLKSVDITKEEFSKLRNVFLDPVLIGKNIFLKTKPDELQKFLTFLKRFKYVDVVLDGLNIAYSKDLCAYDKTSASLLLRNVVEHFVRQSKKVAVFGRKHMNSWPKTNMNFIKQNSYIFLADDVSEDDPFLLYTTMHSGLGTFFVSRDQMRSHKFLLKGSDLDLIFSRWQQKHQYYIKYVTLDGQVNLLEPSPYLKCPHESEKGVWHLPITTPLEGIPGHLIASKTKWLCLDEE